jgi:hypothetical protein
VDEHSNELDYLITKIEEQINHYGEIRMGLASISKEKLTEVFISLAKLSWRNALRWEMSGQFKDS